MKQLTYTALTLAALTLILFIASCDGSEPGETPPDTKAMLTSGNWKMNSVTVDGVNRNDLFTNFTVSFTATGFTSSNGDPVWPASGTWTFSSTDQKTFTRSDGVEVSVDAISETEVTLKLHWNKTTLGSGRVESTEGNYTFDLNK